MNQSCGESERNDVRADSQYTCSQCGYTWLADTFNGCPTCRKRAERVMAVAQGNELSTLRAENKRLRAECEDARDGFIAESLQCVSLRAERREFAAALRQAATALEGVINTACHPDVALRSVMVNLGPVREAAKVVRDSVVKLERKEEKQ